MTSAAPRAQPATRALLAILVALASLTAVACTGSDADRTNRVADAGNGAVVEDQGQAPSQGGRLVYGLSAESDGWNPTNSTWGSSGLEVAQALFDTLAAYDASTQARPNLAESITPNADYTSWTIRVRQGVHLHNGRVVDAGVVADDLEILRTASLSAPALEAVARAAASGDRDVVVSMKRPWANFPFALTTQVGVVADPNWLRSGDRTDPVGTGPFVFQSWKRDEALVVHRNPTWWRTDDRGHQLPYLDEIEFRPMPDAGSRTSNLEAGRIDIMQTTSADHVKRYREKDDQGQNHGGADSTHKQKEPFQVFVGTSGETPETFVQLNTAATPLDDRDARLALAYATDSKTFVEAVERDAFEPATGPFPKSSSWYSATSYPAYNKTTAGGLVERVRATHGGAFTFKVLTPSNTHLLASVQFLQDRWRSIGIDAQIEIVDPPTFATRVATGDYQAAIETQFDSPDPQGDSLAWHPATAAPVGQVALNSARNSDPTIGTALDDAAATGDTTRRKELYGVVQQRLAEDVPYIWLFHGLNAVVAAPSLVNVVNYTLPGGEKGLELDRGTHPLFQIWRTG